MVTIMGAVPQDHRETFGVARRAELSGKDDSYGHARSVRKSLDVGGIAGHYGGLGPDGAHHCGIDDIGRSGRAEKSARGRIRHPGGDADPSRCGGRDDAAVDVRIDRNGQLG